MTGFELNRIHRHINNINKIARQITAKPGKKSANLQPVATRNQTIKTPLHPREMTHEHSSRRSLSSHYRQHRQACVVHERVARLTRADSGVLHALTEAVEGISPFFCDDGLLRSRRKRGYGSDKPSVAAWMGPHWAYRLPRQELRRWNRGRSVPSTSPIQTLLAHRSFACSFARIGERRLLPGYGTRNVQDQFSQDSFSRNRGLRVPT